MKRKFLEDLLKDKVEEKDLKEVVDTILDEHSTSVGKMKGELETANTKINTLEAEKKNLEDDVANRDTQLNDLKNSTEDVAGLKKTIEDLQNTNKTSDEAHKNEINDLKKSFAIENALRDAKARNVISVKALLKLDDIELNEDGSLKGLSEQIETLKGAEDSKFLFDTETKQKQFKGAEPGETGKEEPDDKVDLSKMTYDERNAYLEEHPEVEI